MTIRRLTKNDLPDAALIEQACFSQPWSIDALNREFDIGCVFFGAFMTTPSASPSPLPGGEASQQLNSNCQSSIVNCQLCGYVSLRVAAGEGTIGNLAVLPEYRRQGLGKALCAALFEYAQENSLAFLTLEVRQSNTAAQKLYAEAGLAFTGVRPGFYTLPDEDAVILTKDFCI